MTNDQPEYPMKTTTTLALLAALTTAQAQNDNSVRATSVSTEIKDGHGTVTITVEKDGEKETRTIVIDENTPFQALTDEIVEKLGAAGLTLPAAEAKPKVTYLGVMLNEPAGFPFGGEFTQRIPAGAGAAGVHGTEAAALAGLPPGTGLTVSGVTPGSPAEKAGLQGGDVLAKLNDQILINPAQFTTLVRTMKEGDVVKLSYVRHGEKMEVEATLDSRVEEPTAADIFGGAGFGGGGGSFFGRVLTLDPAGNVIEATPESLALPPTPPQPPGAPLPPLTPSSPDVNPLAAELRPTWEKALREVVEAKQKTASQWQEQLSKWRADWSENQKAVSEEYRRTMEKMGEEVAKAREAAEKASEEARRAVEEMMRKLDEGKAKSVPKAEPKTEPSEPAPLKTA